MVGKYEPITENFIKFSPNSNRLRGRSANHQGSGPYNQGCVFPFVYKGKENNEVSVSTVQPSINLEFLSTYKNLKMSLYTLFKKTESTDFHT